MAMPVSRTPGAKASGTTGAVSVPLPADIAIGDIAILVAETDPTGTVSITVTGGQAWTAFTGSPITVASGSKLYVWWRRHASGNTAPSVQATVDHVCAGCNAYSGCIASGDPVDVSETGTEVASDTSFQFVTTISTTGPDRLCVCICTSSQDSNTGQFTVMTNGNLSNMAEKMDYETTSGHGGGFAFDQGGLAVAGAMGTFAATLSNAWPKAYIAFGLKSPPPVVDKIVTPSALGMTMSVPAPTEIGTAIKALSAPLGMAMSLQAPSKEVRVFPSGLGMAAGVPAPSEVGTANISPSVLAMAMGLPGPVVIAMAVVAPSPLAMLMELLAPTLDMGGVVDKIVYPDALGMALGLLPPEPTIGMNPSTIAMALSLPSPTTVATAIADASALVMEMAVLSPSVVATALVQATALAMQMGLPAPVAVGDAIVMPAALAAAMGMPVPEPVIALTPATIGMALSLPSPTTTATALAEVAALAMEMGLPGPTVVIMGSGDVIVMPEALGMAMSIPPPSLEATAIALAAALDMGMSLPAPQPTVTVHPAVLAMQAALLNPTETGTAIVLPASLAMAMGLPNPTIVIVTGGGIVQRRRAGHRPGKREAL